METATTTQAATTTEKNKGKGKGKGSKVPTAITPGANMGGGKESAAAAAPVTEGDGGKGKNKGNAKGKTAIAVAVKPVVEEKPLIAADKIDNTFYERFMNLYKRTSQTVVELAEVCRDVREKYGYPSFVQWFEKRCGLSRQTGDNFLKVSDNLLASGFTKDQLMKVDPAALYKLAASTMPEPLRKRLIGKAEKQEGPLTNQQVEDAIAAFKSAERAKAEREAAANPAPTVVGATTTKDPVTGEEKPTGAMPPMDGAGNVVQDARTTTTVETGTTAAPATHAAASKPAAPVDELGAELPADEELRETFERRIELDAHANDLREMLKKITRYSGNGDPLYTFLNLPAFTNDIENALKGIAYTRPYALCPIHSDNKISRDKCDWCKGTGWLSESRYKTALESTQAGKSDAEEGNKK